MHMCMLVLACPLACSSMATRPCAARTPSGSHSSATNSNCLPRRSPEELAGGGEAGGPGCTPRWKRKARRLVALLLLMGALAVYLDRDLQRQLVGLEGGGVEVFGVGWKDVLCLL